MKKLSLIVGLIAIMSFLSFGLFQVNQAEADPELSIETIKEQLSNQYPGTIKVVELDTNDGNYWVEMETDQKVYRLKADGDTSQIMQIEAKENKEEKENSVKEEKQPSPEMKEEVKEEKSQSKEPTEETTEKKRAIISREAAVKTALNEFTGTVEEVELDNDDGKLRYEIEIVNGDMEAEIEIDAYTGKIIIIEMDD